MTMPYHYKSAKQIYQESREETKRFNKIISRVRSWRDSMAMRLPLLFGEGHFSMNDLDRLDEILGPRSNFSADARKMGIYLCPDCGSPAELYEADLGQASQMAVRCTRCEYDKLIMDWEKDIGVNRSK